jgi:Tir chaperone protein (CesT) family
MHMKDIASELSKRLRSEVRIEDDELSLSFEGEAIRINADTDHDRLVLSAELAKFKERDRVPAAWAAIAVNEKCGFDAAATIGVPPESDTAIIGRSFEPERLDAPALLAEIDDFCLQTRKLRLRFEEECAQAARAASEATEAEFSVGEESIRV